MSHLGDNISALVDGELSGADLDRASAHLAACERCRGDAAALRALKTELRELAAGSGGDDLTRRLLAMAGPPVPGKTPSGKDDSYLSGGGFAGPDFSQWMDEGQYPVPRSPSRRRSLMWGAVSLAVVGGGVGAAAFSMGGAAPASPGPSVVPPVQMFTVQHAATTGDVPVPSSSPVPSSTVPSSKAPSRKP